MEQIREESTTSSMSTQSMDWVTVLESPRCYYPFLSQSIHPDTQQGIHQNSFKSFSAGKDLPHHSCQRIHTTSHHHSSHSNRNLDTTESISFHITAYNYKDTHT